MIAGIGRGSILAQWTTGMILWLGSLLPAAALDMTDMLVDSISAHPEVKEKIHVYRQAVGDQRIAASGWRPSVDIEATTGTFDTDSPATGNTSVDYESSTFELAVTQNLFNGYDTTFQVEQTDARARAALFDIYDTADNIALRAIQAYLDVLKQRRLYQLAQENVAAHEDILARIRERNLSGVGRRSQLQQTEGRLARAQASLVAQQNNLEDAGTRLHQVLGRYVDPFAMSAPALPNLPEAELDALIDQALANHPAMQVAEQNVLSAQADHRRSLRTRYPTVDLRLATEHGDDIGGLPGNTDETSLVLNLSYNLYRGGRDEAEQQKTISAVFEQKEFAARVRRQVINTLRLAWIADTSLARQLGFLETHVLKAGQTVESYKEEFFIGQRDLIDLLDAENELNTAKNQFAEARFDALAARFRVYEGLGQLFPATGVDFELGDGRLRVARLASDGIDRLPIPTDEDADRERDPMDHCDNSLRGVEVNPFGCLEPAELSLVAPPPRPNSPPVLGDDQFQVDTNGILVVTPQELLANDRDADDDPLEIVDVSQPETGRLAFDEASNLVYRPAEGFVGIDTFKYTVTDNHGGSTTATANVRINVSKADSVSLDKVQLVNFIYDEAELTPVSQAKVTQIIERIKRAGDIQIEIYTYTDNIGSDAYNLALSRRRADALRNLLIRNGIDASAITAIAMGEKEPIADNSTESGQAINRRGEFVFRARTGTE